MAVYSMQSANVPQGMHTQDFEMVDAVYHPASPEPVEHRDLTSFHPDQQDWSWDNLPEILYQLKPFGPKSKVEPPTMTYPINGKFLREISVLPNHIASDVEEFRVEAWMRLDRRIRLSDIIDRMGVEFRIAPNALQQRGGRFRQAFRMLAWDSGNKLSRDLEAELINALIQHGINPSLNTTRGLTPGLINPALGEAGGRIGLPSTYSPEKRKKRKRSTRTVRPKKIPRKQEEKLIETAQAALRVFQRVGPAPQNIELPTMVSSNCSVPGFEVHGTVKVCHAVEEVSVEEVSVIAEVPAPCQPSTCHDWPVSVGAAQADQLLYTLVPFDEQLDEPTGPMPIFRHDIPDDELPEFACLEDLDLSRAVKKPCRRWDQVSQTAGRRARHGQRGPKTLKYPESGLKTLLDTFDDNSLPLNPVQVQYAPGEILQPTGGLYRMKQPLSLGMFPEYAHNMVFNFCLKDYYDGERNLCEMPILII
ncbi:hypothetical protein BO94DRAFT_586325 [Aspergillus sclerotioniger CBS 115572]|uniref:Uncharacterized protein n=1 Tax=Aspergillus sclerotioniger CBS 115572 TaxID=1450535 RepID=A0A317WIA1_9EURO|nr:hypothetical protein BO94DRAFT_586325 [Aspergillus sclerotioniger CBS 115572]PWY85765.1 hypothetical protein BO94DRAFT_586325 [Aspergillus sclerotioniger CBS 115572]